MQITCSQTLEERLNQEALEKARDRIGSDQHLEEGLTELPLSLLRLLDMPADLLYGICS